MTKKSTSYKPDRLDKLVEKFKLFLNDVSLLPLHQQQKARVLPMTSYGSNDAQLGWGHESIQNAVMSLKVLCPNISDQLLERVLQKLMQKLVDEQLVREDADPEKEAAIESLLDALDVSGIRERLQVLVDHTNKLADEHWVLVPIRGVRGQYNDLYVQGIPIYSRLHPLVSQLLQELKLQRPSQVDDDLIFTELKDIHCFTIVQATGDDHYVREIAEYKAREAIKILNFCLSSSIHQPNWAKIEVASVIINQSQSSKSFGYSFSRAANHPFEINQGKEGWLKWHEMLLNKTPDNEVTQRTVRAVTWYSKAVDSESPEESFVNLTTSLESLLIDKSEDNNQTTTGSINQKLRERVTFLLEDTFNERKKLYKLVGELYGERSGIVHNGKTISKQNLIRMDNITRKVITSFAEKQFASWEEFLDWLDRKKFGYIKS